MRAKSGVIHYNYECTCEDVCKNPSMERVNERCGVASIVYKGVTSIWQSYVCPKDQFEKWYKHDYLMGTCELCGPIFLPLCLNENNPNHDYE
jgi:hypothetical protein